MYLCEARELHVDCGQALLLRVGVCGEGDAVSLHSRDEVHCKQIILIESANLLCVPPEGAIFIY